MSWKFGGTCICKKFGHQVAQLDRQTDRHGVENLMHVTLLRGGTLPLLCHCPFFHYHGDDLEDLDDDRHGGDGGDDGHDDQIFQRKHSDRSVLWFSGAGTSKLHRGDHHNVSIIITIGIIIVIIIIVKT